MVDRLRERLREDEIARVIDEARSHAHWLFRTQSPGQTLQPTALVNEAFLRVHSWVQRNGVQSSAHFKFLLARSVRRILIDSARKRRVIKVTLDGSIPLTNDQTVDVSDLERFLDRLAEVDPKAAEIVILRFYGGLTEPEIAQQLGESRSWVQRRWRWVRSWAARYGTDQPPPANGS